MRGLNIKTFNKLDLANKNSFCQKQNVLSKENFIFHVSTSMSKGGQLPIIYVCRHAHKRWGQTRKKSFIHFLYTSPIDLPVILFFFFFLTALLYCAVKPSAGRSKEEKKQRD